MKFKLAFIAVYLVVLAVGMIPAIRRRKDENKPDMYLPDKLLAMAILFAAGALALVYFNFFKLPLAANLILSLLVFICAMAAFMCWKNQKIRIVDNDTFVYTTFLGNEKVFRFDAITGMKRNRDSLTLFVGEIKVHIESIAILSPELVEKINAALNKEA